MSSRRSQGVTCRADLLRLLAVRGGRGEDRSLRLALDETSDWVGYRFEEKSEPNDLSLGEADLPGQTPTQPSIVTESARPALMLPRLRAMIERESRTDVVASEADANAARTRRTPLRPEDFGASSPTRLIEYEHLVPIPRLLPALRRELSAFRHGPIDFHRLACWLAERRTIRRLPRGRTRRWSPELVVVLDFGPRMRPFDFDLHDLAQRLTAQCGRDGLSLRIVESDRVRTWVDWHEVQEASPTQRPQERTWTRLPQGTRVLIVSDVGAFASRGSQQMRAWQEFVASLVHARARPSILAPVGQEDVNPSDFPGANLLRWSPDSRLRAERRKPDGAVAQPLSAAPSPALTDLLAMMSVMVRVDPQLLRAMRRLNPRTPHDAGLEGHAWNHLDIERSSFAVMANDARRTYRDVFRDLDVAMQSRVRQEGQRHHAHLRASVAQLETLLMASSADSTVVRSDELKRARQFLGQLVASLRSTGDDDSLGLWCLAREYVEAIDLYGAVEARDLAETVFERDQRLERAPRLPSTLDPAHASKELRASARATWYVVEEWRANVVRLTRARPSTAAMQIGEPIVIDGGGARIVVTTERDHVTRRASPPRVSRLMPGDPDLALGSIDEIQVIEIETATGRYRVEWIDRPRGCLGWSRNAGELSIEAPMIAGLQGRFDARGLRLQKSQVGARQVVVSDRAAHGVQAQGARSAPKVSFELDTYGLLADLVITGKRGRATQRFRWIEPGSFMMGSPESEAEADDHERPQHIVHISHGFWLADTACTQEFWRAVMDGNASAFRGPNRPVENVSWDEVHKFLAELNRRFESLAADLPTEAEWEYACRAGTTTRYSFGDEAPPERMRVYKGLESGTVDVKSYPANGWGLYEMHGNVREWCADGKRSYAAEPVRDPHGAARDSPRVIRGGSWIGSAGFARSAYRYAFDPGYRDGYLGFRFCLRSVQSGMVPPAGPSSPAEPGGRGPELEKKPPPPSLASRLKSIFTRRTDD